MSLLNTGSLHYSTGDLCGASRRAGQKIIFHNAATVDVLNDFQLFNSCRGAWKNGEHSGSDVYSNRAGCPVAAKTAFHQKPSGLICFFSRTSISIGIWIKASCRYPITKPVLLAIAALILILPQEALQLSKVVDVMACIVATRHARP